MEPGSEKQFKAWIESAIKFVIKKPGNGGVKLPFGPYGCQEESWRKKNESKKVKSISGKL